MTTMSELDPALKWPGSKRWMIPRLREIYGKHRHRRLVEPFVGSMAVALGLNPDHALLQDVNPHLVNFHTRLCDPKPFQIEMENTETLYYGYRKAFNELVARGMQNTQAAAEIFYYLNRTGFNGLCRFNASGEYNVPYGKYDSINYRRDFSEYAPVVRRWELWCGGFETILTEPNDFVYLDPPYDDTFTDYSAGGFSWRDQIWLAKIYANHPGPVVASNQATERVMQLYRDLGFKIERIEAPRMISSDGNREPALEMFATKNV